VEHLLFKGKARDDDYSPGKKAPKMAGEQATQKLAVGALNRILENQLPAENERLQSLYPQAPAIQVDVIYTDQGPEFGNVWREFYPPITSGL
jgi:hypothetical protein